MVPVFLRSRNRERDSAEKFTPEMSYRKLLEVKNGMKVLPNFKF